MFFPTTQGVPIFKLHGTTFGHELMEMRLQEARRQILIAYRTGHSLQIDPKNGHILGDRKAARLWTREYAPGWKPTI